MQRRWYLNHFPQAVLDVGRDRRGDVIFEVGDTGCLGEHLPPPVAHVASRRRAAAAPSHEGAAGPARPSLRLCGPHLDRLLGHNAHSVARCTAAAADLGGREMRAPEEGTACAPAPNVKPSQRLSRAQLSSLSCTALSLSRAPLSSLSCTTLCRSVVHSSLSVCLSLSLLSRAQLSVCLSLSLSPCSLLALALARARSSHRKNDGRDDAASAGRRTGRYAVWC